MERLETRQGSMDNGKLSGDGLRTFAYDKLQAMETEMVKSVHLDEPTRHLYLAAAGLGGSVLGEGTTGIGKTKTAKTLAAIVGGNFARVQGTADVTPDDITGVSIWNPKTQEFEFREGPIFADVVLIDEINRISPKAQSGALEAMGEGQVTAPGSPTRKLPESSVRLATQNPLEDGEGTNHLTKAQKDRFNVSLRLKELESSDLLAIDSLVDYEPAQIAEVKELPLIKRAIGSVGLDKHVNLRAARLINDVLPNTKVEGMNVVDASQSQLAGYRGYAETIHFAKAFALLQKESVARDSHVDQAAPYALRHRVALTYEAMQEGITPEEVIAGAISHVSK